jgi:hypothetical protein
MEKKSDDNNIDRKGGRTSLTLGCDQEAWSDLREKFLFFTQKRSKPFTYYNTELVP